MYRFLYLLLLVPNITQAETVETWVCTEHYKNDVLAIAYVNKGRNSGKIKVAGVTHEADFGVKGFERRWNFGLSSDFTYDYSFIIEPNGNASYYDFSHSETGEIVKPSIRLKCKNKQ
jgi:hypothetical protein